MPTHIIYLFVPGHLIMLYDNTRYNNDWAVQQFLSSRAMEEAHLEEKYMRASEKELHMKIISEQKREYEETKLQRERDRFGSVGYVSCPFKTWGLLTPIHMS